MDTLELQRNDHDCGPTALLGALRLLGRKIRYQDLYRWAGTTSQRGTSAAALKRVLQKLNIQFREYSSKSRQSAWCWARKQNTPALLSFDNDEHWVLLVAGMGRRVLIHDPELGLQICSKKDFMARWVTEHRVYALSLSL